MILLNQEQHLGRKAYLLLSAKKSLTSLLMLAIAIIWFSIRTTLSRLLPADIVGDVATGLFLVAVVSWVMNLLAARRAYLRCTFTFEEFGLRLKKGTVKLVEVSIPYRQMQDINVERGIIHQMTGTSKVIINTASDEENDEKNETDIVLDPIDQEYAEEIRQALMRKIGVQVVEEETEAGRQRLL